MSRKQPEWHVPKGTFKTGLVVANSLTNRKDEFVPENGKQVKWYICGPTVYDSSHLGHARTYLSFDIIRRILEDYFGYDVHVCMNITDIDDKIISSARKNYLFDEFVKQVQSEQTVNEKTVGTIRTALVEKIAALTAKHQGLKTAIESKKRSEKEAGPELNLAKEKLDKAQAILTKFEASQASLTPATLNEVVLEAREALNDYLDQRLGSTLPNEVLNRITKAHTQRYEEEYMADMKALGIKTPDTLTRVTEYVEEIIDMCQKIIKNGYAYEAQGSVYFDVGAFDKANNHHYAKLIPSAYSTDAGALALLAEGEGALSGDSGKQHANDFALWKASKAGEPVWDSPWGKGRPGWHIECSAMAGTVLGSTLDIHAGGHDLKFPHHDNELAQSEAFFDNTQWVNYFLHTGHLHIDGLKMSKSLKNFVTIREMLAQHPARQVRLLFLMQSWDNNMNYQRVDTMKEVIAKEKHFKEFFLRVEQVLGERTMANGAQNERWNAKDKEFGTAIEVAQAAVHKALSDNFDTADVMVKLSDLVTKANIYMEKNDEKKAFVLKKAAVYITRILRVFGVVEGNQEFGFGSTSDASSSGVSARDVARPYVAALVDFRKVVRSAAKEAGFTTPVGKKLMEASDALRDEIMPKLDVKIADDGEFGYVFQDAAELEKERLERLASERANKAAKLRNQIDNKEKDLAKWKAASETAEAFIKRTYQIEMKTADDKLPETDLAGSNISNSRGKSIKKDFAKQHDAHTKYQAELAKDSEFVAKLELLIQNLKQEFAALQ